MATEIIDGVRPAVVWIRNAPNLDYFMAIHAHARKAGVRVAYGWKVPVESPAGSPLEFPRLADPRTNEVPNTVEILCSRSASAYFDLHQDVATWQSYNGFFLHPHNLIAQYHNHIGGAMRYEVMGSNIRDLTRAVDLHLGNRVVVPWKSAVFPTTGLFGAGLHALYEAKTEAEIDLPAFNGRAAKPVGYSLPFNPDNVQELLRRIRATHGSQARHYFVEVDCTNLTHNDVMKMNTLMAKLPPLPNYRGRL